jgi:hypothetical protein
MQGEDADGGEIIANEMSGPPAAKELLPLPSNKALLPPLKLKELSVGIGEWKHGVCEFESSGLRPVPYLVVPKECNSADELLAVMCKMWNLEVPKLVTKIDGLCTWLDVAADDRFEWDEDLKPKPSSSGMTEKEFAARFEEVLVGVFQGLWESKGWFRNSNSNPMIGWNQISNPDDFNPMSAQTCKPDTWNYESKAEMVRSALSRYQQTNPDRLVPVLGMLPPYMLHHKDFLAHAVPLCQDGLKSQVGKHLIYPDYHGQFVKGGNGWNEDRLKEALETKRRMVEEGGGEVEEGWEYDGGIPTPGNCILPHFTHLLVFQDDSDCHSLFGKLSKHSGKVEFFCHGGPNYRHFLNCFDYNLRMNKTMLLLDKSGGATDIMAEAVRRHLRHQTQAEDSHRVDFMVKSHNAREGECVEGLNSYTISTQRVQNVVILDLIEDTVDTCVDKMVSSTATIKDYESSQLGNYKLETQRLKCAWEMVVKYQHHGSLKERESDFVMLFVIFLGVFTSFLAVAHVYFEDDLVQRDALDGTMSTLVKVLPVLATIFIGYSQAFNPIAKANLLRAASKKIESEIYKFRARVGSYAPEGADDEKLTERLIAKSKVVRSIFKSRDRMVLGSSQTDRMVLGSSQTTETWQPVTKQEKKKATPLPERRKIFAQALDAIQTIVDSELSQDALSDPPCESMDRRVDQIMFAEEGGGLHKRRLAPLESSKVNPVVRGEKKDLRSLDITSAIPSDVYLENRVIPMLARYSAMHPRLARNFKLTQVMVMVGSSGCVLLGMMRKQEWIPVVLALQSACSAYSDYKMYQHTVPAVHSAIMSLKNLLVWWRSLSMVEKRLPQHMSYLVKSCEAVCMAEIVHGSATSIQQQIDARQKGSDAEADDVSKATSSNSLHKEAEKLS